MTPGFTMIDNDAVIDRLPEIDGSALKVLLALARRADSSGRCWPSQPKIATDTGLRPRAVRGALARLRALALIETQTQPGHATIYHVTPAPPCRPNNGGVAPPCRTPRHHDAGDPGTAVPTTPAPPCLQNNTQEQHPKNKTQRTRPKARGCAAAGMPLPAELDSDVFRQAWGRWQTHRTEIRKKLTPSTAVAQLRKLAAIGEVRAVAAINRSIEAGWTGIFEERNENGNHRSDTSDVGSPTRPRSGKPLPDRHYKPAAAPAS